MDEIKAFDWVMLKKAPQWTDIETAMNKLADKELFDAENKASQLHTQFVFLKNYCIEQRIVKWRTEKTSVVARWVQIFSFMEAESCPCQELSTIVEYILCLPGTSAPVERIFSAVTKAWTTEKTQLKIENLKGILFVKYNLKYSCSEFFDMIKRKPELLKKVSGVDKYAFKSNVRATATNDDIDTEESDIEMLDCDE